MFDVMHSHFVALSTKAVPVKNFKYSVCKHKCGIICRNPFNSTSYFKYTQTSETESNIKSVGLLL